MGRWVINVDCVFAAALSTPLQIILTALTVFPSSTLCFYYDDMIVTNIFLYLQIRSSELQSSKKIKFKRNSTDLCASPGVIFN